MLSHGKRRSSLKIVVLPFDSTLSAHPPVCVDLSLALSRHILQNGRIPSSHDLTQCLVQVLGSTAGWSSPPLSPSLPIVWHWLDGV